MIDSIKRIWSRESELFINRVSLAENSFLNVLLSLKSMIQGQNYDKIVLRRIKSISNKRIFLFKIRSRLSLSKNRIILARSPT